MTPDNCTIRSLRARAVEVPMPRPLLTGGGQVSIAPLVLLDLETHQGITGRSYIFGYTPVTLKPLVALLDEVEKLIVDQPVSPLTLAEQLQGRFRLLGTQGLVGMAMAGVDIAAWDILAKATELPLVRLLGGQERPIPAYNSCGLGISNTEHLLAEARDFIVSGFGAVKVRLGYPDSAADVAAVRAVRQAVGDEVLIMSDYNQSLSVPEASSGRNGWTPRGCTGSRNRPGLRTMPVTPRFGLRPARRSRLARTVGGRMTWPRQWRPGRVIFSCRM